VPTPKKQQSTISGYTLLMLADGKSVDKLADAEVITLLVEPSSAAQLPALHAQLTALAEKHGFASVQRIDQAYRNLSKDGRFKLNAFRESLSGGYTFDTIG